MGCGQTRNTTRDSPGGTTWRRRGGTTVIMTFLYLYEEPRVVDDEPCADGVRLGGGDAGVVAPLLAREPQ